MAIRKRSTSFHVLFIISMILFGLFASVNIFALEPPILPHVFYGNLSINNSPATIGATINVGPSTNFYCGIFSVQNVGRFGILTCSVNNPNLPGIQGANIGNNISFYYNGTRLWIMTSASSYIESVVFDPGNLSILELRTPAVCGDNYCDPYFEFCSVCIIDCGICSGDEGNFTGNLTPEELANLTNQTGGGPSVGSPGSPGVRPPPPPPSAGDNQYQYCSEKWVCDEWQPDICPVSEEQFRDCYDENNCNTFYSMPATTRECEYLPLCTDVILNGLESDVDCGGPECQACTVGKQCRVAEDCVTLSCDPYDFICRAATCDDGIQNQGESGIDCGGPCDACEVRRPTVETPAIIVEELAECGIYPYNFIMYSVFAMILFMLSRYIVLLISLKNTTLEFEKKVHYRMSYNRTTWWILGTMALTTIGVSFYVRIVCGFAGSWAIALLLLLISLISYALRGYLVYDEKRAELRYIAHLQGHSLRTEKIFLVIEAELKELMKKILLSARSEESLRKNELLIDIARIGLNLTSFKNERVILMEQESKISRTSDLIELARIKSDIMKHADERNRLLNQLSSDLGKMLEKIEQNYYDKDSLPDELKIRIEDVISGLRAYNDAITTEIESRREDKRE